MREDKSLSERLKVKATELGFAACGVAPANAAPLAGARLHDWLASGAHGDMIWMEQRAHHRESPAALWPEVRSVIALGMSYAPATDPLALADAGEIGRISVYAQGGDYHDVVKRALKHLARWLVAEAAGVGVKVFVDTAPVMEKPLAAAAGLGWQGKHTNLVSREHGSWLFLGAIYTTLEIDAFANALRSSAQAGAQPSKYLRAAARSTLRVEPGPPPTRGNASDTPVPDSCGSCTACQVACPTNAFPVSYRLDARRCISYLTIEHAGPIPHEFRRDIGNRIYGCDDCLAVCPWNKFAVAAHANKAFAPRAELAMPALADLLALSDADFRVVFAGSPIKRIGRDRMVRNCLIAAGNSGSPSLVEPVAALLDDPATVVRGAAVWALSKLESERWQEERNARLSAETDASVAAEWNF